MLCPPYDVISPAQQAAYAARDPHNAVRIVLNPAPGDQRYAAAAVALRDWLDEGILRRGENPAFYVHRHTFQLAGGGEGVRTGLIAAVKLEPWASGAVRPHEHTMPGPKEDRLKLMRATQADTEPIWVFHPDPDGELQGRLGEVRRRTPLLIAEFRPETAGGEIAEKERHEIWAVDDPVETAELRAAAGAGALYVADGHHRYETALFHAEESGGPDDAPTRFKVMLVTPAKDPGFLVLPTHRMVRLPAGRHLEAMLAELEGRGWSSQELPGREALLARLGTAPVAGRAGFGVCTPGQWMYLEGVLAGPDIDGLPPSIAALDVGQVHEGVLRPLLGIGQEELAAGQAVAYARDAREVEKRVSAGEFDFGVLMRPPTLSQIKAVADAGENMPQKSTYFWPKPASGLIMALQEPGQSLDSSFTEALRG